MEVIASENVWNFYWLLVYTYTFYFIKLQLKLEKNPVKCYQIEENYCKLTN